MASSLDSSTSNPEITPSPPPTSSKSTTPSVPPQVSLEELTRKTRDLRPDHLPGAVLKLVRPLSSHFQISHSLFIPETLSEGYYTYGATYVGNILNENEANPIMNGEISPSGLFSGVYINKLSKNVVGRINGHYSHGNWMTTQMCIDRQTEKSAFSVALDRFNPFSVTGLLVAQFMRKINNHVSLGFDLQAMRQDANKYFARCGAVGYFKLNNSELLLNVANKKPYLVACLTQKIDIGPEYDLRCFMDLDITQKETMTLDISGENSNSANSIPSSNLSVTGSIGYNFKIPSTGFIFKAAAKSDASFVSSAEYRISGLPLTFGINALLNHQMDRFSTGFKVIFGQ